MKIWNRGTRLSEIYGTIIFLGLLVYFFTSYALGFIHIIGLRALNLGIVAAGVYYCFKQYKRTHNGRLDYFRAITLGTLTSAIGVSTFALFLFIYLFIDTNLMNLLSNKHPLGIHLDPYMASFSVFYEGLFSGFGVSYLLTNFLATDTPAMDNVGQKLP